MNFLDIRTIIFSHVVIDVVCAVVMAFLWSQNRKRFAGTAWWVLDFALQAVATVLIVLRGSIPDWISMVVSNTLVMAGALCGYLGLERFVGKIHSQAHNYALLVAFAGVHAYFTVGQPNLAARTLNVSLGLLLLCSQCAWLMLRRVEPTLRPLTRGVGLVFAAYGLVSLVRIIEFFTGLHPVNDFFQSGAFETLTLLAYQILLILLTYSLALMVNGRLIMDIRLQEEKFTTAFHSAPYAITLTRLTDGKIFEVNDSFVKLSGYRAAEVLGHTTPELHLWADDAERQHVVRALAEQQHIHGRECRFRQKSGDIITGLLSAELLTINNQPCVLSNINDISERKRAEVTIHELAKFPDENPNPVLRISRDGRVLYANQGSADLLQCWQRTVGQYLPDRWHQIILETLNSGVDREEEAVCGARAFALAFAPIVDGGYVNVYGRDITVHKHAEDALREREFLLRIMAENYPNSYISIIERDLTIGFTAGQEFKKQGLDPAQFVGLTLDQIFGEYAPIVTENYLKTFAGAETHFELLINNQHQSYRTVPLVDQDGTIRRILTVVENITERKQAEQERNITIEFLRLINERQGTQVLIQSAVTFFQQQSGCDAVGVRLKEGDDYPYFEARGFPPEFLQLENSLCVRDLNGQLLRDDIGNSVIECMCGNVICGRFDPSKPFFTVHGSFWSNNTTALLASTTDADRQTHTRNRCNGEGYESVALLPLIFGDDRLGLLQLNDRRIGVFSPELIALWERLAGYLAVALAKSRAAEALRESEDRYRTLFENAQIGIYRTTPDGRILAANPALIRLLGYASFEELVTRNLEQEGFEPNYPRSRFKAQMEREGEVRGLEGVWTRRDNSGIIVHENARAIRGENGVILYYEGTVEDITERKRAEEELRRLNAQLEQRVAERTAELSDLYNNAPCGYHSLDGDGVFVRINDTELKWLGYTRAEIIGKMKATDILTPASVDTFCQNFPVFKARGWLENLELDMVRKNGSVLPVLLNATIVADQAGRYLMSRSTMIDYTERRRAEAALRATQARLETVNQELEAFAYSVSHDLRAPLRAIDGFTRIILEDYGRQFDAEGQRLVNVVCTNVQKMDQLITDLLALSRITRSEMRIAPLDMTMLVQTMYQDIAPPGMPPNVVFSVASLPEAQGDATLIRQVWSNLLANALKYTRPKAERRIQVGGYTEGDMHVYYVQDNGVGFDPRYTHKLFSVFQRLHKANEFEGTGVGLAIVQRIIQRHGGKVWAESVLNQGATFYFALPTLTI